NRGGRPLHRTRPPFFTAAAPRCIIPHSHDSPFPIADSHGRGGGAWTIPHSRLPIPKGRAGWGGKAGLWHESGADAERGRTAPLPEIVMRILGIILIVLGVIGIAYGGITYTRHRDTINVGPVSATVQQKEKFPIPPVAGVIALIVGIGLLVGGSRRTT